jgi:hypothetical protein
LSEPIKLLFDECLGKPLVEDIKRLLSWESPAPTIAHLLDFFTSGTPDADWIPNAAKGGWLILTSDRGSKSGRMKLPAICQAYGITHILMGPSVLHLKQIDKARQIVTAWEEIKKCNEAPRGTRFLLQLNSGGRATVKRAKMRVSNREADETPPRSL